ncbi:MAG: hypothetical protein ABSB75_04225 [Candidatus Limnocylindrales bacterium]
MGAPDMASIGDLLAAGMARLRAAGSESARLDAELLLGWAVGAERTAILAHPEAPVGADAAVRYEEAVARREKGEPVAYLRGLKEFYGLAFAVDRRAMIPRPETELLVERAEAEVAWRLTSAPRPAGTPRLRVVDVGTGSGAIAIALAHLLRKRRMLAEGGLGDYVAPRFARPGDSIIVTKGPAIEASGIFAAMFPDRLEKKFGAAFARRAEKLFWKMSVPKEYWVRASTVVSAAWTWVNFFVSRLRLQMTFFT